MRSRVTIISILVALVGVTIVARLFFLQILHGDDYREMADRQYAQPVAGIFNRGSIYFTEKSGSVISAASLKTSYGLTIDPSKLSDPASVYEKISHITPLVQSAFMAVAIRKNDSYEVIAKGLSKETADEIPALKLTGVSVYKERSRLYPAGPLAAHVLGFAGLSKNTGAYPTGRYGIEKQYDALLSRSTNELKVNFFAELFANIKDSIEGDLEPEGDVVLSIEPTVQTYVEKQLADVKEKWNADSAGAVVIEPATGRIVAMAGLPTFDPNAYSKEKSAVVFSNPLVENVYEMGSIVKPLTLAAAIDAGVITSRTTYDDKGSIELNGKTIKNFDGKARGVIPMQEVLNQSLNMGAVFAMQKLGRTNFRTYMRAYGLGEETGIDLPNETSGLIKGLDSGRDVEAATASFGQGIAITPIEIVRALSVMANGGVLVRPHVVDKVIYRSGIEKKTEPVIEARVLKEQTAATISDMLTTVVDEHLANGKAKMEHYSVAAKTGTAQMANPHGGGYYDDRYLHSFFGYFPNRNARFLTFLYLVYPKGVRYSSETLTEPFLNITKYLIHYYDVPPDR